MAFSAVCGTPPSSLPMSMPRGSSLKARVASATKGPVSGFTPRTGTSFERGSAGWTSDGGARRISSSPTESFETSVNTFMSSGSVLQGLKVKAPSAVTVNSIVGFALPSESPALAGSPSKASGKKAGLLSRALTLEPPEVQTKLPSLPEHFAGFPGLSMSSGSSSAFFPDVDLTLLRDAQERHPVFHHELVTHAFSIAAHAHKAQMRMDGTSVLSHCVLTALHLADMGLDEHTVAAALLHEAIVDNDAFRPQLEEFMPKPVIQLVDRVTTIQEISRLYRHHRDQLGDEKLRRMMLAMEDVKAVLVALACRVHNMKTCSALPREKQLSLAQETLDVFSVVANRLGVWCLKAELEDLAFSVLHPEEYASIQRMVAKRQDPAMLEATITRIREGLDKAGVKYEDISGRPKNIYGIWLKMKESGSTTVDHIYDVMALRVVVANKHDCYYVQRVVQQAYRCMASRSKDFIKVIKKPNGYQSLHETIIGEGGEPVEVQIRTHKMHFIAEYGFAAHWKYKENLNNEDEWMDKEVQYKKWLTAYKLGVHDKKVRASGAPTDGSLKSLGMHLLDQAAPEAQTQVDPFLRHDRFKLQQPERCAVAVVLQTQDSIDARELPRGTTVAQLSSQLGVAAPPGYAITVNQKLPASGDVALQSGDLIQVVPWAQALSRSPSEARKAALLDVFVHGRAAPVTLAMPGQ